MSEDDDSKDFREAMKGVQRLQNDKLWLRNAPPKPVPRRKLEDEQQVLVDSLSDGWEPDLHTGEELEYCRPGIQRSLLRQLRRGAFAIEGELDLHGLRVEEARVALQTFMARMQLKGARVVRIIHGKGRGSPGKQPILKIKTDRWLRQWDSVLAYTSARPEHGGTGAVYVLLKRSRHER